MALHALGQAQQAQVLADPADALLAADPLGDLLVGGEVLGLGQVGEAPGGVDRVEILADQVLDQGGRPRTLGVAQDDRDLR